MTPLTMAPWVFLFGLTISCVIMGGAGPETQQDSSPQHKWRSEQGMVPAKTYRSMVERFVRVRAQLRNAYEERHREREARSAWETEVSNWHSTVLAIEVGVLLLLILGLRIRSVWISCKEASTPSDTWHGEQDSDQVLKTHLEKIYKASEMESRRNASVV